jgi:hypothetical protein
LRASNASTGTTNDGEPRWERCSYQLGAGECLFGETGNNKPMRLVDTKAIGDGLAFLAYELVSSPLPR